MANASKKILFLFKQSSLREQALHEGGPSSYLLYGMPELAGRGYAVEAVPLREATGLRRWLTLGLRSLSCAFVGYSGNCGQILASWREIRSASVLVLTANNVSIPVLFLRRLGFRFPRAYMVSVGLETLYENATVRQRRGISALYRYADRIAVFSASEKDSLVRRLGLDPKKITAIPYGIAENYLPPRTPVSSDPQDDVLSVGADIYRDLPLLVEWARAHPHVRVRLVVTSYLLPNLSDLPENVRVECDISLRAVFDRLRNTRTVVIPVRENHYTAGTTFLIHALASGRPVLVAKTSAVETLYNLEESGCLIYRPEDQEDFARGMERLLNLKAGEVEEKAQKGGDWVLRLANGKPLLDDLESFIQES